MVRQRIEGMFSGRDEVNIEAIKQGPWPEAGLGKASLDMIKIVIGRLLIEHAIDSEHFGES